MFVYVFVPSSASTSIFVSISFISLSSRTYIFSLKIASILIVVPALYTPSLFGDTTFSSFNVGAVVSAIIVSPLNSLFVTVISFLAASNAFPLYEPTDNLPSSPSTILYVYVILLPVIFSCSTLPFAFFSPNRSDNLAWVVTLSSNVATIFNVSPAL